MIMRRLILTQQHARHVVFPRTCISTSSSRRSVHLFRMNLPFNQQQRDETEREEDVSEKKLEDLSEEDRQVLMRLAEQLQKDGVVEAGRLELPSPGQSSGDPDFDESVRAWRLANTVEDPALKKLFKKNYKQGFKGTAAQKILSMADNDSDDDEVEVALEDEEERAEFVNPYNAETGEHNGPTGPEPTRYGDWERKGRVSDF